MIYAENRSARRKLVHRRIRKSVSGVTERPRLCVFRSTRHIYAQIVDDAKGTTLIHASTLDKGFLERQFQGKKTDAAKVVGEIVAKRALEKGIKTVCFDRGGYRYHGRIKALADAAREAGLQF